MEMIKDKKMLKEVIMEQMNKVEKLEIEGKCIYERFIGGIKLLEMEDGDVNRIDEGKKK